MEKQTFLLYKDLLQTFDELDYAQIGEAFWAVLEYVNGLKPNITDPVTRMAYKVMVASIDANDVKWHKRAEKCRAAATARWEEQKKDLPAATDKP